MFLLGLQVERLTHELSRWKQRGKELDADVRQQQKVVVQLQQAVQELQLTCGVGGDQQTGCLRA